MDLLYQAAVSWKEITDYQYLITYGYKKRLSTLRLSFSPGEFPHLAGFQYLKDISLPNYSSAKVIDRILDGKIRPTAVEKALQYESMVRPRLTALTHLKASLDDEFSLYSYMPHRYPFYTSIKADYLIADHSSADHYVFIIHANSESHSDELFSCCSIFQRDSRDYTCNQRSLAILRKERLHVPSATNAVLYNRLLDSPSSVL